MKKTIMLLAWLVFLASGSMAQIVTDYDGNVYDTVNIGTQVWLKQNLKTTHFNNGTLIPNVADSLTWTGLTSAARCYYKNDSIKYNSVYGPLYNWYAAYDTCLCPPGWHVPSNAEWQVLENYLGGAAVAGGKMKETDTAHWAPPNSGATNSSGFTGLPGGGRSFDGSFQYIRENGLWWTSTSYNSSMAWGLYLWYLSAGVEHDPVYRKYGVSIRCLRNANYGINELNEGRKCRLYPNPAKEMITVEFGEKQDFEIQVFNIIGSCVMIKHCNEEENKMDIGSLPGGIYIVKLIGNGQTAELKLIKE